MKKKPKLKIVIDQASHFFRWERPFVEKYFEIVEVADSNTLLYAYGPDVFPKAASMPALKRVIMLFPGFGCNPYHNLEYRQKALELINNHFDLAFVNPGPLEEAYKCSPKVFCCPFTIDSSLIKFNSYRKRLNSLLHVSNPSPQKDWKRSLEVMQNTHLLHKVFPPRNKHENALTFKTRLKNKINYYSQKLGLPLTFKIPLLESCGYVDHEKVIEQYQKHDGFVHIAAELVDNVFIDGKYTACVFEAGLTGAIIFWHDTLRLGNDFETFFNLPLDPKKAADEILLIRNNVDIEKHSKRTREEILDRCDIGKSVHFRMQKMMDLL